MENDNIYDQDALELHSGHFRRDKRTPYYQHLRETVRRLIARGVTDPVTIKAGWLHDSIEDKRATVDTLINRGIAQEVIDVVLILTKTDDIDYFVYLERVKQNNRAREIKICDILANLSDSPTDKQILKYSIALQYLIGD